jgi:hypothetical protein
VRSEGLVRHLVNRIVALDDGGASSGSGSDSGSSSDGGGGGGSRAINAVVIRLFESALERARAADAALERGEVWGPLHGVPMTVKESFCLVGAVASSALPRLAEHLPKFNAVAVQRLLDAGAVVMGKTNLPLNCGDFQTFNEVGHGVDVADERCRRRVLGRPSQAPVRA